MAVEGVIRSTGSPGQAPPGKAPGAQPQLPSGGSGGQGVPAPAGRAEVQLTVPRPATARPAPVNASASFSVDEGTGLITIKLVNVQTGELIRRIPPRDYIQLVLEAGAPKGTLFEARS